MPLSVSKQVELRERARQQAMVAKDLPALADLLDDDLIYVHSTGRFMDKREYLAHVAVESFGYVTIVPVGDGLRVVAGGDCVVLAERVDATMRFGVQQVATRLSVVTVWRRARDVWRLVSSVSAKVTE